MYFDLHSHSHYSDGKLSPLELAERMKAFGIDVFALTDHDTIAGVKEAQQTAQSIGIQCISGVEISTRYEGMEIHIVGLNVDVDDTVFQKALQTQLDKRWDRVEAMAKKLEYFEVEGVAELLAGRENGQFAPGRPHFARLLIDAGLCKNMEQAFKKFLGRNGRAFVGTHWVDVPTAVEWIRAAGGIPVLAHPNIYKLTRSKLIKLIQVFKEAGGQALEVQTASTDANQIHKFATLAKQHELWASQGADFHTPDYAWTKLGKLKALPDFVEPVWHHLPV